MSSPRGKKESKTAKTAFWRRKGWQGPAIILLATVFAMGPLLVRGPSWSGDLGFHLTSWIDAKHSLSTGLLYPHWAESPNFGAGEPRFVFYPPISWMSGALLGTFLPWRVVPLAFFLILLAATGLATRAFAREVLPDGPATLAGCTAIFLGYVLFSVYRRNDFAELIGGFWIPLLLLFALRRRSASGTFWERTFDGSAAPLTLVAAGILLSNGPLAIMTGYLLAAVALVSALVEKSLVPVVRAAVCALGGMGLASVYLVPAIWEADWISLQYALKPINFRVENSWLFGHHADPLLVSHDMMLRQVSVVAVVMLAVAFAGGAIVWIRGVAPGERRWRFPLALIPPTVLLLLLPVSLPVWNALPELRLLQFPWRWLIVLVAPMSICFAAAVWVDRRALRISLMVACAVVFAGVGLAAPNWWFVGPGSAISSIEESVRQGSGVLGKPEYAPPGIRSPQLEVLVDANGNSLLDPLRNFQEDALAHTQLQVLPTACLLNNLPNASGQGENGLAPAWHGESASCDSTGWREMVLISDSSASPAARQTPEKKWIVGVAEHAGYLIVRLRYYPAWNVMVNGVPVRAVAERERGLLAVQVPQGKAQVIINWMTTGDVVAGRWVSGVTLLLVAGLFLFERKRLRAHSNPSLRDPLIPTEELKPSGIKRNSRASPVEIHRKDTRPGKRSKDTRRK